jgi:hypothetical protein
MSKFFSAQPTIPSNAKATWDFLRPEGSLQAEGVNGAEISKFKSTYVMERNVLQRLLNPEADKDYRPSSRLSGDTTGLSIEDTVPINAWESSYVELRKLLPADLSPTQYVRVVFWLLRAKTLTVPDPKQLKNVQYLTAVLDFWNNRDSLLEVNFCVQCRRMSTDMTVFTRGYGWSRLRSIYRVLSDAQNGLTTLFRYSLARTTIGSVRVQDMEVGDTKYIRLIDKHASSNQILASLDYSVFPEVYDRVWAGTLPESIRGDSERAVAAAVRRFN